MKCFLKLLPAALLALSACESTTPPRTTPRVTDRQVTPSATSGEPPSTYVEQGGPPDAQVIYQNNTSRTHVRSTTSGIYLQRGGVTEEIHIGNQRLGPGQSPYPATHYRNNLQRGYMPAGPSGIYDPATGRVIPVRR